MREINYAVLTQAFATHRDSGRLCATSGGAGEGVHAIATNGRQDEQDLQDGKNSVVGRKR